MLASATFVAIYVIVWWLCLFIVLPFGVRNQVDAGARSCPAPSRGAPVAADAGGEACSITTLLAIADDGAAAVGASSNPGCSEYWS